MDPVDSDSLSRVESYSGYRSVLTPVTYGTFTLCGRPFQTVLLGIQNPKCGPTTPESFPPGLGSSAFARRYLRSRIFLSLPPGNEMFQFPGLARVFRDQNSFDSFPGLFAVFHAL